MPMATFGLHLTLTLAVDVILQVRSFNVHEVWGCILETIED